MAGSCAGHAPLVYLITDRRATCNRPLATVVARALEALPDAGWIASSVAVQLREKDLGGRALAELGRALRDVTAAAGVRLFVNDRVDVALAIGADGVHLGGGALTVEDARVLGPELEIALSTHAPAEVAQAAADPRVSFVVFGPVFDTPSKREFGAPPGILGLREACNFPVPVLALGGIGARQIPPCRQAGAAGVAAIRGILSQPDPREALRSFFGAIEST